MNDNEYPYGQDPTRYPYGQGDQRYPYGQPPERPTYLYGGGGQTPYGGGQSPYGGGQSPYGGGPYGYVPRPPKKPLGQRVREVFSDPSRRNLMLLGMAAGTGILLYLLCSDIFSSILTSDRALYRRYLEDDAFSLLVETMYTIFCMALPFSLVLGPLRKMRSVRAPIRFGKPGGGWQAVLLLPAGLAVCLIGSLLSSWFVSFLSSFGLSFHSYEYALQQQTEAPETPGLMLLTVVHTAILPALLEELVFRGFILQPLRKYGDWFAIVTSALIFGLIHGNMMQAPFAILAGVALGYVNVVTGSMWTNILLHFLNNLISVLCSFAMTASGEGGAILISAGVMYGMIGVGIAAFIGYARANRNFARLRPGELAHVRRKAACYWLMPTLLLSLALLAVRIAQDIYIK